MYLINVFVYVRVISVKSFQFYVDIFQIFFKISADMLSDSDADLVSRTSPDAPAVSVDCYEKFPFCLSRLGAPVVFQCPRSPTKWT